MLFWWGGTSQVTWANAWPRSREGSTTGYDWLLWETMKAAYTVPFGPTATDGSSVQRRRRRAGQISGALNVSPPSWDRRANTVDAHPVLVRVAQPLVGGLLDLDILGAAQSREI